MQDPAYDIVEKRRLELVFEHHDKEEALRRRASDLQAQSMKLSADIAVLTRAGLPNGAGLRNLNTAELQKCNEMTVQVNELDRQRLVILRTELPAAQRLTAAVGNCLELQLLYNSVTNRLAQERADAQRNARNRYAAARSAFDEHLEKIANGKTLTLAQALADASRVAKVQLDPTVEALLATDDAPVAA